MANESRLGKVAAVTRDMLLVVFAGIAAWPVIKQALPGRLPMPNWRPAVVTVPWLTLVAGGYVIFYATLRLTRWSVAGWKWPVPKPGRLKELDLSILVLIARLPKGTTASAIAEIGRLQVNTVKASALRLQDYDLVGLEPLSGTYHLTQVGVRYVDNHHLIKS